MNTLPDNDPAKVLFDTLINVINKQAELMAQMAEKINVGLKKKKKKLFYII